MGAMLGALARDQEGFVRDLLHVALAGRSGEEVVFCQPRNRRIVFAELWARLTVDLELTGRCKWGAMVISESPPSFLLHIFQSCLRHQLRNKVDINNLCFVLIKL